MGYTLKIGQFKPEIHRDGLDSFIFNDVEAVTDANAPAFGEPTDYTNERWPSYTAWADSIRFVGLEEFMYNKETGLIRNHPGCVPLVQEHKAIIDKAYKDFYEKYPNCKPGYPPAAHPFSDVKHDDWPKENSYAARLEWLKYWVDWALENCEMPVFINS
jgi:hypothetical protein